MTFYCKQNYYLLYNLRLYKLGDACMVDFTLSYIDFISPNIWNTKAYIYIFPDSF